MKMKTTETHVDAASSIGYFPNSEHSYGFYQLNTITLNQSSKPYADHHIYEYANV
jgi:hypothetical protein